MYELAHTRVTIWLWPTRRPTNFERGREKEEVE